MHVIDRSRPFGSFTFASIDQRVTTRLGADDRLLTLVAPGETPPGGAFGRPVTTLKMPGHLVKGVPGDATVKPHHEPGRFRLRPGGSIIHL